MKHITCKELIDFLDDYVSGELSDAALEDFDRHLRVCPSCRAYLSSYRDTIRLAQDVTRPAGIEDIPPDVLALLLSAVARNTRH